MFGTEYEQDRLIKLKEINQAWLMRQPDIHGVSVGLNASANVVLRIFASHVDPERRSAIEARFAGAPVEWEVVSDIIADI